MQRINAYTQTATEGGLFTGGNPAQGVPATVVIAEWLNMIQEELANLVEELGLELDSEAQDQLATGLFGMGHAWTKAQRYTQTGLTITDNAVTWDCQAVPSAVLVLVDDVTSLTITNYEAGGSYDLAVIQNGTGGRTCTMPSALLWPGGAGYEVSTDPLSRDLITIAPVYNPNSDTVEPWATANNAMAQVS